LHELTEGWPLGLQLALSAIASGQDARAQVSVLALHGGELSGQLVNLLISNFAPADIDFLVRMAALDALHPEMCRAVTASDEAPQWLARMSRDTPVFAATEHGE